MLYNIHHIHGKKKTVVSSKCTQIAVCVQGETQVSVISCAPPLDRPQEKPEGHHTTNEVCVNAAGVG